MELSLRRKKKMTYELHTANNKILSQSDGKKVKIGFLGQKKKYCGILHKLVAGVHNGINYYEFFLEQKNGKQMRINTTQVAIVEIM